MIILESWPEAKVVKMLVSRANKSDICILPSLGVGFSLWTAFA